VPHEVVGEEAAEYYTPERLAATGPFPLGQRRDLIFFNGRLITHMDTRSLPRAWRHSVWSCLRWVELLANEDKSWMYLQLRMAGRVP
jgi:hypothetical protein